MSPLRYCLDTSTLNDLHDETDRDRILLALGRFGVSTISALNVLEACCTADHGRRVSLLEFLDQLRGGGAPLPMATDLLRLSLTELHESGSVAGMGTSLPEDLMEALTNPRSVDEELRSELLKWKANLDKPSKRAHTKARKEFEDLHSSRSDLRPRTAARWIKQQYEHWPGLPGFCAEIYATLTEAPAPSDLDTALMLQKSMELRLFLFGIAHPIFQRAIKNPHAGKTIKAGTVDYWFSIYLPHCDYFFTSDCGQHRALRQAKPLQNRCTRILHYRRWRKTVGAQ